MCYKPILKAVAYFALPKLGRGTYNKRKYEFCEILKVRGGCVEGSEKYALLAMELPIWSELPWESKQYASKGAVSALLRPYAWWASVENARIVEKWKNIVR